MYCFPSKLIWLLISFVVLIVGCDEIQSDKALEPFLRSEGSDERKNDAMTYIIRPSETRLLGPKSEDVPMAPHLREYAVELLRGKVPDGPNENFFAYQYYLAEGNTPKAIEHLKISSLYGNRKAHKDLAIRYESGDGVDVNYKVSYLYYYLSSFQYSQFVSELERQSKYPALIEKFQEVEGRLGPYLSEVDREWVRTEFERHNDTLRLWLKERSRTLRAED